MTSTTHIAGPRIEACGRIIQRCSLCGEKLCDSKNVAMPLEKCTACDGTGGYQPAYVSGGEIVGPDVCPDCGGTGDKPPVFATWEVGRLVRVTPGQPTSFILLDDTCKLPDDSCIDLVE